MVVFAVVFFECGRTPAPLAGGASSTEVSACEIEGIVVDSSAKPVSGSMARLRPFNYIPMSDSTDSIWTIQDTISDADGRYKFENVKYGRYTIELLLGDSLGQIIDCPIDSGETLRVVPAAMLQPMAVIVGSDIPLKPDDSQTPSIHAIGMEHTAPIDSTGHFTMKVPAGWTRLSMEGIDPDNPLSDTLLYLRPGERLDLKPTPQSHPKPCDSLDCELAIVRAILDSAGLSGVEAESVVVIFMNRVTELHLRSRGISTLSRSIGKLSALRVLDIGKNFLDSLPSTLSHLHNLEELVADSNFLWIIPASIGMMESLRQLDLSYNMLQSLPEPITYLRSLRVLKLDGNMLCNIGEMTARWLDHKDPGWKMKQQCQ